MRHLPALKNELNSEEASGPGSEADVVPLTPDVDLLLACTFSYMHRSGEDNGLKEQPVEEQEEEFLSPLIGPQEETVYCCCLLFIAHPIICCHI